MWLVQMLTTEASHSEAAMGGVLAEAACTGVGTSLDGEAPPVFWRLVCCGLGVPTEVCLFAVLSSSSSSSSSEEEEDSSEEEDLPEEDEKSGIATLACTQAQAEYERRLSAEAEADEQRPAP